MATLSMIYLLWIAVLLIDGGASTRECTEPVDLCIYDIGMNTTSWSIDDILGIDRNRICRLLEPTRRCLHNLEDWCEEAASVMNRLDELITICIPIGVGPGPRCSKKDYKPCGTLDSQEPRACRIYKCIRKLKFHCKGDGFKDYYNSGDVKTHYDLLDAKCNDDSGCSNLQASVLALLITVLTMMVRLD